MRTCSQKEKCCHTSISFPATASLTADDRTDISAVVLALLLPRRRSRVSVGRRSMSKRVMFVPGAAPAEEEEVVVEVVVVVVVLLCL